MKIAPICIVCFLMLSLAVRAELYQQRIQGLHKVRILEEGPASYIERLELIRSAEKSLDIEYFIFKPDLAGQVLVQALKERALKGVKVRVLIDKSPLAPPLGPDVAFLLSLYGIEIKYFNPITFLSLSRAFHRTHRKFIIADGVRMVTGGRNIGEEYYLLKKDFAFIDRDIYVEGPIVENIVKTFEAFCDHALSKKPKVKSYHRRAVKGDGKLKLRHRRIKKAWKFLLPDIKAQQFHTNIEQADNGNRMLSPTLTCQDMEFVSDRPDPGKNSRLFADVFYSELEQSKQKVVMETPYFITMERDQKILDNLLNKGISLELVTNSTNSNNHPMVSNVLNRVIRSWVLKGLKAFFMTARRPPCLYCTEAPVANEKVTYGLHSKSTVIDDQKAMFITFNMDPQSQLRSIEMGLFCHDGPALAQELTKLIEGHKQVSFSFDEDGRPDNDLGLLQGTNLWEKFMYYLRYFPALVMGPLL
ncbi:MAG: hypothetical protein HYV97_04790 [Bdellovibrio sp.]|nr:hypothetical protein [Bdellovibrio sp.]